MTDGWKFVTFTTKLEESLYGELLLYCKRTNGNLNNEIGRLIRFAIAEKYKQFPNLITHDTQQGGEQ